MVVSEKGLQSPRVVGRYMLFDEIASGGMATVRFGRLLGEVGFSRTVAIKCLHPQFAKDQEFAKMFLDEARLAARVRHPNVVPILDVVARDGELFLVMEYVQGETLSRLVRAIRLRKTRAPLRIITSIIAGVLDGLHAAHEATSERGDPLGIVHRDVSPQNVIVGLDGVARVLDFGVAKATGRLQTTRNGQLKGKLAYMAPEQLQAEQVDRRTDIYAVSVVLWEALTGRRLFKADDEIGIFGLILKGNATPPSEIIPSIPKGFDEIVLRGLHLDPEQRFPTAREMATAIEKVVGVARPREVGAWVEELASETLRKRADKIAELESVSTIRVAETGVEPASLTNIDSMLPDAPSSPPPPPSTPRTPNLSPPNGVHAPRPVSIDQTTTQTDCEGNTINSDATSKAVSTAATLPPLSDSSVSSNSPFTSSSMAQEPPHTRTKPRVLIAVIVVALLFALFTIGVFFFFDILRINRIADRPDAGVPDGAKAAVPLDFDVGSNADARDAPSVEPFEDASVEAAAKDAEPKDAEPKDAEPKDAEPKDALEKAPIPTRTIATTTTKTEPNPTPTRTVQPPTTKTAAPPTTSKPPREDCNPPYVIDSRGIRVPKIQCL